MVYERVKSVKKISERPEKVYCLEVEGNNNFFANSILVHNCDDPIKGHTEAKSKTMQKRLVDWYDGVGQTRLSKGAGIIIMHTRWHKKDLAGVVIEKGEEDPSASQFEVICFPAAYNPNHKYVSPLDKRTYAGEALWPNFRENDEELKRKKADVGSYTWAALFDQSPTIEGGNIIKEDWINLYQELPFNPNNLRPSAFLQSWDLQFKDTGTSYTVGGCIIKYEANFYLVDIYRKKADVIESAKAISKMAAAWPKCNSILIEDKANGPAILTLLKKKVSGMLPVKPDASKDERLHSVAPLFEAGNIYIPANHPETKNIIEELTTFPNGSNDDIVDMFSQGLNHFSKLKGLRHLRASVQ